MISPPAVIGEPMLDPIIRRQNLVSASSAWDNHGVIIFVAAFRIICLIIWIACVIYGTYAVYLAGQEYPPKKGHAHPLFNAAPFRLGRDGGDEEWNSFLRTLVTKLGYWYFLYILLSFVLAESPVNVRMLSSIALTCGLAVNLIGWTSVIFLFKLPIAYCGLMNKFRRRSVIWGVTIFGLWLISFDWIIAPYITTGRGQWDMSQYWFQVIAGWHFARCVSFCFDNWDVPQVSLWNLLCYCFYFPTAFTGPIVLYSTFQRDILQQQGRRGTWMKLFWKSLYIGFITLLCELVLHVLHFRRLAWYYSGILQQLNMWALGGIIFWLGQFFMLKYMVIYGIGTIIAQYEGLEMPPLPKCPSHIHRYSVIWKDFDRGLYDFLVKYTYIPSIKFLEKYEFTRRRHPELKKLIASSLTFFYVYVWHELSYSVEVWTLFNFIGISIERTGSFMKRRINGRMEIHPMVWDFVLEPILTIPLAAMSIINSAVFLCSVESAKVLSVRFYSTCLETYTIPILFCLTNVAVGIRTLPVFLPQLVTCLKSVLKITSYQSSKQR